MNDLICKFEYYLKEGKQSSANTITSYIRDVSKFFAFFESKDIQNFERCKSAVNDYIEYLQTAGKSTSTINRTIVSLRVFFGFLISANVILHNPVESFKSIKKTKTLPRILTNKEVNLLLSQPKCDSLKGYRDKAMLELLYATGIRVSELIDLNLSDVNTLLGFVYCKKSTPERVIPLYQAAISAVENYVKESRPLLLNDPEEEALFVNLNGTRMTRQGFWKIIKHYQQESGIKTDITPQVLRHSFATHLLENGADIGVMKDILGHSNLSSTIVYAQLIKKDIKKSYIKFHPRA